MIFILQKNPNDTHYTEAKSLNFLILPKQLSCETI